MAVQVIVMGLKKQNKQFQECDGATERCGFMNQYQFDF